MSAVKFAIVAVAAIPLAVLGVVKIGAITDPASPPVPPTAPVVRASSANTSEATSPSTGNRPPSVSKSTPTVTKHGGSKSAAAKAAENAPGELEGFTEPYRTINLAAEDMGTIEEVLVREGDAVKAGQPLARLNSAVHQALLAIAEQNMKSEGRLDAAQADLRLRKERLQKLEPLRALGHARQEEVDRAQLEVAVAEANLRTAREDLNSKRLECEKIKAQISCRTVRASVDGVVTKLHKQMGEFVAPNSPDVATLVQLDKLFAIFTVTNSQAVRLRAGEIFPVRCESGAEVQAVVEFVSPVTNAESGTVLIKLRIDNVDGRVRGGERCYLHLAE